MKKIWKILGILGILCGIGFCIFIEFHCNFHIISALPNSFGG